MKWLFSSRFDLNCILFIFKISKVSGMFGCSVPACLPLPQNQPFWHIDVGMLASSKCSLLMAVKDQILTQAGPVPPGLKALLCIFAFVYVD